MPAMFAIAVYGIGNPQLTPFVAFGCFGLLVMADFGGPRKPRAVAYVATALVGAVLIVLGTLASSAIWIAVPAMFAIGCIVQFSGVFGGYTAAAVTALLLSFVLSVSIPAPASDIWLRLAGWLLAASASTLASVTLWPRFEQQDLHARAADVLSKLAVLITTSRSRSVSGVESERKVAAESLTALRRRYATTRKRPAGPGRSDRALVELISEIDRTLAFVKRPFHVHLEAEHPCLREGDHLASAIGQTLEQAASALTGGPSPDLGPLRNALDTHREALDLWALTQLREGAAPEHVMDGLAVDDALRAVSFLTVAMTQNAAVASGYDVPEQIDPIPGVPIHQGVSGVVRRVLRSVKDHSSLRSSVLQTGLRTGVGLALAVLVSQSLHLDHAFWVVLGTLSVLRSNALSTGRTTLQALAGTVLGFALAGLFTAIVGPGSPALWLALPVMIFVAAYGSTLFGFLAGQAGFTIVVITIFNIIAPVGWRLGLARVEDVAVGAAISVLVGLILWPSGARRELAHELAAFYGAVATFLDARLSQATMPVQASDSGVVRAAAVRTRDRAGEALNRYVAERGAKPLEPEVAGRLLAGGADSILFGDLFSRFLGAGYETDDCPDSSAILQAQLEILVNEWRCLSRRMAGSPVTDPPSVNDVALRQAGLDCLTRWSSGAAGAKSAIATVVTGEWIDQLGELAAELDDPVKQVIQAARTPWWR